MSKLKRIESALLFLTLLFLPTQLGKHFWPEFSFIYSLPIDYLSPTIYFWDLLVVFLMVVWLISKPQIKRGAFNLFLIFILSQAVSLVGGDGVKIAHGLVRLEQYLICGLFGVYIASLKFKVQSAKLFWLLALAVFFEALLAILQFLKAGTLGFWILGERSFSISTPAIAKFDFYGVQFLRPYATFPHPNVLAGFMVVAVLILSFWRETKTTDRISNKMLSLRSSMNSLTVFLAGLTVLLTASRVAIVAGFLAALFLLKTKGRIMLLVLVLFLLPFLYTRFASAFNFDVLSIVRREEQSVIAFKLWLAHPLFGVGLNNFIPAASDQLLAGPNRFLQPVHNIFLLSLAETGILGLVGFILLIGYPIKKIFNFQFSIFNLLPWIVVIFLGLFDHYFLTLPQGYRLLFLVWGLSLSTMATHKEERES